MDGFVCIYATILLLFVIVQSRKPRGLYETMLFLLFVVYMFFVCCSMKFEMCFYIMSNDAAVAICYLSLSLSIAQVQFFKQISASTPTSPWCVCTSPFFWGRFILLVTKERDKMRSSLLNFPASTSMDLYVCNHLLAVCYCFDLGNHMDCMKPCGSCCL
jgi:hypothetical protein